jgi:hypothetical protein
VDGGFGAILLIVLVVLVPVAAVLFVVAFVVFLMLGGVGFLAINDRVNRAKRLASEAGPEDAW